MVGHFRVQKSLHLVEFQELGGQGNQVSPIKLHRHHCFGSLFRISGNSSFSRCKERMKNRGGLQTKWILSSSLPFFAGRVSWQAWRWSGRWRALTCSKPNLFNAAFGSFCTKGRKKWLNGEFPGKDLLTFHFRSPSVGKWKCSLAKCKWCNKVFSQFSERCC